MAAERKPVLVFGGTTEGRTLVEWLAAHNVPTTVCSATEYGGSLLPDGASVHSIVDRLDADAMCALMQSQPFVGVVDATHPYAAVVSENIKGACESAGLDYLRVVRAEQDARSDWVLVPDAPAAAAAVAQTQGNVMLTTGSKDLRIYAEGVPDFAERLYPRILPVPDSLENARSLGYQVDHIIAMQGPFTRKLNEALIRMLDIKVMVTKDSGATGGFMDKIEAAEACGITTIVIGRPLHEEGFALEDMKVELARRLDMEFEADAAAAPGSIVSSETAASVLPEDGTKPVAASVPPVVDSEPKKVHLVGIGMGDAGTLTGAARTAIDGAQLLIGAKRLLEPFADVSAEKLPLVRTAEIVEAVRAADAAEIAVLFSGDTGFFSGAATFLETARDAIGADFDIDIVPGISSLQFFCARTGASWDDARILSVHGRACDYVSEVRTHKKTFLLTGGTERVHDVCARLAEAGLGDVRVSVGERLSYADERIVCGSAAELAQQEFADLSVMLVDNAAARVAGPTGKGALLYTAQQPYSGVQSVAAPRILVAAPASGTGKTTIVCGLLQALIRRGMRPLACKCGPDYIDPMFHSKVIGAKSRNLDLFFADGNLVRATLARDAAACDITVIEGAMGYYDGIAMSDDASAWDVARSTATPTVLVVDGRGRARSIAAEIAGFIGFHAESQIAGVILNRVSAGLYPRVKELIEAECGVSVLGYVPRLDDFTLESRHLGLVTADEVADLHEKVDALAARLEQTLDMDAIVALARTAPPLMFDEPELPGTLSSEVNHWGDSPMIQVNQRGVSPMIHPRIAVAQDAAFCFYYDDTLRLFERMGAEVVPFSPLADDALPEDIDGLYLGGGYPELYAAQLSANEGMRASVKQAVEDGLPTVAECGGFLYLHESLEDDEGVPHPMVGVLPARAFKTEKLGRFGYITLTAKTDGLLAAAGEQLRAHEFHYWESERPGEAFAAQKPLSDRGWECCITTDTLYAGFPHLYLPGSPQAAWRFVQACTRRARG